MDIVRSAPPPEELAMFLDRCAIRPITPRFVANGRLRISVGQFWVCGDKRSLSMEASASPCLVAYHDALIVETVSPLRALAP